MLYSILDLQKKTGIESNVVQPSVLTLVSSKHCLNLTINKTKGTTQKKTQEISIFFKVISF